MIRVRQVKVSVNHNLDDLKKKVIEKLKIKNNELLELKIIKKSIDAREKVRYIYEVDVLLKNEQLILNKKLPDVLLSPNELYEYKITGSQKLNNNIIIIGSGPAGLFSAYLLSLNGYNPIIIERGEKIEQRVKTVQEFWEKGNLNENSNVQFGEGGAGTFSDGKLNTQIKDKNNRIKEVLNIFVANGADEEIKYLNKPHIGTDKLRNVIINMREKIIENGGKFYYNTCLTDLVIEDNKIKKVVLNNSLELDCEVLILAIGHSSFDTIKMLSKYLKMENKPFAVGVRIQHKQDLINKNQYGSYYKNLPPADYKLTYNSNKRGIYSFCMCPGGYVVNASSIKNRLVINGMSNHARDTSNSNSAIVVTVNKNDYGENLFAGIEYQKKLEEKAYKIGQGKIPIQLFKDFVDDKKTTKLGTIEPILKGDYILSNLNEILPKDIANLLKEGILYFDKKITGFASSDAILAGIETRTSSPIRIIRTIDMCSNVLGIYPIGEGSGYSGGITSSAVDGIKVFEKIISIYRKE